jgi:hypothetical protein
VQGSMPITPFGPRRPIFNESSESTYFIIPTFKFSIHTCNICMPLRSHLGELYHLPWLHLHEISTAAKLGHDWIKAASYLPTLRNKDDFRPARHPDIPRGGESTATRICELSVQDMPKQLSLNKLHNKPQHRGGVWDLGVFCV